MANKQEQINEFQRKNLEAAMRLAQMSIENSQRIMELQVATAKSLFEEGVQNAQALNAIQDPKEIMELRTRYAQSSTEKMLACARKMAELTTQTQTEIGKVIGQQLTCGGQDVMDAIQKIMQGMPITDQNAMTVFQTAMDTSRAAFEKMTQASADAFQLFNQLSDGKAPAKGKR